MKKIVAFAALVVMVLMVLQLYVNNRNANPDKYLLSVAEFRQQKDEYLRTSPDSPFGNTGRFKSLYYFDANPKFKIDAPLRLLRDTSSFFIRMSNGTKERFRRYGFVVLPLDSLRDTLFIYQTCPPDGGKPHLFAPFTDASNGNGTYEGGRYLDIEQKAQGRITVDFNFAYNPYCVYNYNYSCPIPPAENHLRAAIIAGEKNYPHKKVPRRK